MTTDIYEAIGEHIASGGPVINVDPTTGWDQDDPRFNAKYAGMWDWPFRSLGTASDTAKGAIAHIMHSGSYVPQARGFASALIVVRNGPDTEPTFSSAGPPPVFSSTQAKQARKLYLTQQVVLPYGVVLHGGLPESSTGSGSSSSGSAPVFFVSDAGFPANTALVKAGRNGGTVGGCFINTATGGIGVEIGAALAFAQRSFAYGCSIGYMAQGNGVDSAKLDHCAAVSCGYGVKLIDDVSGDAPNDFWICGGDYSKNTTADIASITAGNVGSTGAVGLLINGPIRLHGSGIAYLNQGFDSVIFGPNPYVETQDTVTTVPRVSWGYATTAGLLVWKGAWSAVTAYIVGDGVVSGGARYVCVLANTNNVPPNATYWRPVDIYAPRGGMVIEPDFHGDVPINLPAGLGFHLDVQAAYGLKSWTQHRGQASDPTRPFIYMHEGAVSCETHIVDAHSGGGVLQTTLANMYKDVGTGNWVEYNDGTRLRTSGTPPWTP